MRFLFFGPKREKDRATQPAQSKKHLQLVHLHAAASERVDVGRRNARGAKGVAVPAHIVGQQHHDIRSART